ncbi:hypothetical protein O9992_20875 [Vibrio lentus]|nr:hypothetical protein [Vibrio lentus]
MTCIQYYYKALFKQLHVVLNHVLLETVDKITSTLRCLEIKLWLIVHRECSMSASMLVLGACSVRCLVSSGTTNISMSFCGWIFGRYGDYFGHQNVGETDPFKSKFKGSCTSACNSMAKFIVVQFRVLLV